MSKKIVLHLGLPKTGTTTLQRHLFQRLHEEGEINFLGKLVEFNSVSTRTVFRNYRGSLIREYAEGRLESVEPTLLDEMLSQEKLNVFSDEGIMIAYPGENNLTVTEKVSRLAWLLREYDVQVVIALRHPVDYFYSLYVQLYPDFFRNIDYLDTFEKWASDCLDNQGHIYYESFEIDKILEALSENFQTYPLLYEDLKHFPEKFSSELAGVLGVNSDKVNLYINGKKENVKKSESRSVYSERGVSTSSAVASLVNKHSVVKTLVFPLRWIYRKNFFYIKNILSIKLYTNKSEHRRPDDELTRKLAARFRLPADFDCESYGLCRHDLVTYKYPIHFP